VKYLGVLYAGGKEFDSSWSRGAEETLPFQVGGRREVIVSPADGYGAAGSPPAIPPNATLIFVIDLVKVG
jgi:peptidylprolyl isomerase